MDRTNTPLQALTLLNDTVFVECAGAGPAHRWPEEKGGTEARLRYGFRLCVAQGADGDGAERLAKLYDDLAALCRADPEKAAKLAGAGRAGGDGRGRGGGVDGAGAGAAESRTNS